MAGFQMNTMNRFYTIAFATVIPIVLICGLLVGHWATWIIWGCAGVNIGSGFVRRRDQRLANSQRAEIERNALAHSASD